MDWIVSIGIWCLSLGLAFNVIQVLFCFVYLYIETRLTPEIYANASLAIISKNYLFELVYVLSKYLLYPIKFFPLKIHANAEAQKIILLVHGYRRSPTDWIPLLINLRTKTTCPVLTISLSGSASLSIQELAAILKIQVDMLSVQLPLLKEITLVGHSMGGLVCAYYQEYLAENNLIKKIITLGSPFYGTKVAVIGSGASSQQMQPNAKFLLALREKINQSYATNYYQLASNLDNLIYPWQSAIFETKQQYLVLNNITHLGLISNKKTVDIISS